MPYDLDDEKHMMTPHRDHASSRFRCSEAEPVGGQPQIPHRSPEHLDGYAAAAESAARTAFGVSDYTRAVGKSPLLAAPYGFSPRVRNDNRAYLTVLMLLGVCLALALLGLWRFAADPHVAGDDAWCSGFDHALSCTQDNARK